MRATYSAMVARKLGAWLATRPGRINWPGGVVSFTFDDFPKTALANGGAILRKYGACGTYYTALGMVGMVRNLGPMFEIEDIKTAHRDGHEIACHTFNHLDLVKTARDRILGEVTENAAAFAQALDGVRMTNFAYPFGAVSITAKRALANRFACCRGTGWGINSGAVDLADLLSSQLYASDYDRDRLCGLIDENKRIGGWLIFYTHDVADKPSDYGCTPGQLDEIVGYAAARSPILTVRDVTERLGFAPASA